jgi:hypothetical protein
MVHKCWRNQSLGREEDFSGKLMMQTEETTNLRLFDPDNLPDNIRSRLQEMTIFQ